MIRASIQRVLLQAISRANGQISAADVRTAQMIATNVHLDSGSLVVGKVRFLTEDPTFTDLIQFAVDKALADSAGINELFAAHLFKNVSEVVSMGTVSDIATKDFGKGLIEAPSIAEALAYDLDKQLVDAGVATDVAAKAFSRPVTDSFASSDAYVNAFGKNPSDTPVISDAQVFVVGKALSDTTGITEDFQRVMAYSRSFSDSIVVADSISPNVVQGLNQIPQNSAGVADVAAIGFNKPFSESPTTTDSYVASFFKALTETPGISEQAIRSLGLVKSDAAEGTDSALILLEKNLGSGISTGDTADASENVSFAVSLVKVEAPSVSETIAKSFSKAISDTADISESASFAEGVITSNTADASDSTAFSFNSVKTNTFDAADAYAAAFSKNLEDPANGSDSGVLLAQGYVSSTDYFSDDFVGVKRTLT